MMDTESTLRPTSLTVHCDCDRQTCNGEVVEISTACAKEIYIRCDPASVCPANSTARQQAQGFYSCLPRILERAGAEMAHVVLERVFFRDLAADHDVFTAIRSDAYRQGGVPEEQLPVVSYVEQPPCTPKQAFELQAYAVVPRSASTASVLTIPASGDCPAAKVVEINGFRHLYARGLTGNRHNGRPCTTFRDQCDTIFAAAAELLGRHGASFGHILRTWWYLDDIERDYRTFNIARNDFFRREEVHRSPASSGIRAGLYPPGTLCGLDLYALLSPEGATVEVMHCTTLNDAPQYGSAFSRGMKLCLPEKTILFISGTASVDESGATAHGGESRRQIERMLLNVEQLLAPHGASFQNLAQVVSYLKSPHDLDLFRAVVTRWGLTDMPNSIVTAQACRPDLLCEMEAIAVLPREASAKDVSWTSSPQFVGGDDVTGGARGSGLASAYVIRSGTPGIEIPQRLNAATMFVDVHVAEGRGTKTAILCEERAITYNDLQEGVNRVGNALKTMGVRMEERVAILLPDSPEWVFAFFGAMKMGAVAVPFNTNLKPSDYQYLLNDSRARVLFIHPSLLSSIEAIRAHLDFLEHVVVADDEAADEADGPLSLTRLLSEASPSLEPMSTSKDDAAFWLYSSGTTGAPKGAIHLHHDMLIEADLYSRGILGLTESDVSFSVAKLFFAYGLGNGLYFPLRAGGTTVLLPDRPTPEKVFALLDRYQPTVFYSVPTSYVALLRNAEKTGRTSLDRVRLCVSAGEPLPKHTFEKWQERFGVEILDGIGSTEILHIYISNRPGRAVPGSTGQIVPGYEAKIVDQRGDPLPPGHVGTLLIKGDSIAAGYWNNHEQTKDTFCGHWINTHDKFSVDEDGFFWYAGRTDDMFKVSGQAVWPADVESVLLRHAAVLESGVVGAAGPDGLVQPVAYVVLKDDHAPSPELAHALQEFVKNTTNPHKYPRAIVFVESLPKTATGKIKRYELRDMARKQQVLAR
ncbi:MAG: benzoate-CoA ligase family protein [Pirellulaceae bacterium]